MISTRSVRLISVLFLATMLLTACGGSSTAAASDWSNAASAEAGGGMDALVAAAQAEGELNVIALPEDWCNYGGMIATFEDKYGIKVNSITPEAGSADEVQAIIDNKENKGPQAPDVIDVGPAYGPSSKDQDLLAPYKVTTWDSMTGVKDADGYYYTDYNGVMVFEVNTDVVTDVPQDYADLLDPKYNGQVALAGDPRASNQAAQTVYAAALANGGSLDDIQPGLEYFKALNENGNLLPLIANTGSIAMGETPITFQWNYLALANDDAFAGNPPLEIVYPTSVSWGGYYLQAISAYAPHPAAARLWQEFLYSDEGQTIWMTGYCAPARLADMLERGVVSADLQTKLPDPSIIANAVVPDGDQLSAARDLIKEQWDSVVGLDIKE
ncbi:ABC transporter substrate-binding protein [Pelolinea submarina]|uniref:Putative spermidine/putrescine transport system substrate-binding protein n=1 Tax=Pelolinea submarina TaxID=913107 RepID=A0A347ZPJ7_9CHLR|nr:ABC transporter substrate-binding protein [Pelolinea submarina]REG04757.1 putative spermidine/putrescine transport system substrate-binding protein [Pelolinea submarina]BBB47228.1 spermidine/putrescine transport system substrate-binding protein [Pelolinea submarina]